jgi:hypothetical protein
VPRKGMAFCFRTVCTRGRRVALGQGNALLRQVAAVLGRADMTLPPAIALARLATLVMRLASTAPSG